MADVRDYDMLLDEPWKWWILDGFCVTFIRGITARALLDLIGADVDDTVVRGEEELSSARPLDTTGRHIVGATDAIDGWALLIETHAGYLGVSVDVMATVAADHDVVSIYGAEGRFRFELWADGTLQVSVDPTEPSTNSQWNGADPGRFTRIWDQVRPNDGNPTRELATARALFATAEQATGVTVTADLLTDAEFVVGSIPKRTPAAVSEITARLREAGWRAQAPDL